MSLTDAEFRLKLRYSIRDIAGIASSDPTQFIFQDDEIDEYVQWGVLEYSRYAPKRKPWTLSLVPGQSQYTLPDDWLKIDLEAFNRAIQPPQEFDPNKYAGYFLPSLANSGLMLNAYEYDWYDSFVIVSPTPEDSISIPFAYYVLHTLDSDGTTIPAQDTDAVVYSAANKVLDALAVDRGNKMQKYKIGQGLMIDDSEVARRLQEQATTFQTKFDQSIRFRGLGVMG